MLGGLARWLRMLGYVTEYDSKAEDNILLRNSQTPDTVLLTRDDELYNRALAKSIHSALVPGDTEEARLPQLARTLSISLDIDTASTRCPECGGALHAIPMPEASSGRGAVSCLDRRERILRSCARSCQRSQSAGVFGVPFSTSNAARTASDWGSGGSDNSFPVPAGRA